MLPSAPGMSRSRELGAFLRSRRARLRPEDVGLGGWGQRRVPGLRREEVAQLANVGVTWYTWLEQGRDVHPSDGVLHAIADALQLDSREREHMFTLARGPERRLQVGREALARYGLDDLVAGFESTPAYAISARFDVLAHNRLATLLLGDLGSGADGPVNLMRLAFTAPAWRELIVDWEQEAATHVAMYRAAMTVHLDDPEWIDLPDELQRSSADFARYWSLRDVAGPERRLQAVPPPGGRRDDTREHLAAGR